MNQLLVDIILNARKITEKICIKTIPSPAPMLIQKLRSGVVPEISIYLSCHHVWSYFGTKVLLYVMLFISVIIHFNFTCDKYNKNKVYLQKYEQ